MQQEATSAVERLLAGLAANAVWLKNSAMVSAGSVAASALGFVYWWLAARYFAPDAVGSASALISFLGLVAVIGEIGLGTFLVGEAQAHHGRRSERMAIAALVTSVAASLLCGGAILAVAHQFNQSKFLPSEPLFIALLLIGCGSTAAALVLDQICVGFLSGHLNFLRNVFFSASKLVLLGLFALRPDALSSDMAIVATWVLAALLSLSLPLAFGFARTAFSQRPDFEQLFRSRSRIFGHYVLNLVTFGPGFALPIILVAILGPAVNAAFYPLWTILSVTLVLPASLTIVLYTVVSGQRESLLPRLSMSLRLCFSTGLVVALIFWLMSERMLSAFNPSYLSIAGGDLRLLGLGFLPIMLKDHYIALSRLENKMMRASGFLAFGGIVEIAFAAIGAHAHGLFGFVSGWLLAGALQSVFLSMPLFKVFCGVAARRPVACGSET
ncbi:lipopolysaccharide biosynthesis protein [Methylocystis parvus]|uniref:Oligosaccharide flippase family protein n=1 Tax=Methylocystis parvus TaxID=134 RepID=A0A6B8MBP9_9HYPH|nr:hypothetical protein [Methylocystis parvus]QGM99049.1 hypothetical protein F7D14_17205 [Methylocystis parvus]WBK00584.1 hypothetical protein MMG94_02335 [Methylocystis parvus OBBP]